jgi:hypothetical protein
MPPTTKLMGRRVLRYCLLAALVTVAACGTDTEAPMTYSRLFARYFAQGTPGHCSAPACHLDGTNGWTCGTTKDICYEGMVGVNLINPADPLRSTIADPLNSSITWVNPNAVMPPDDLSPLPEARDAILEWIAAGALND